MRTDLDHLPASKRAELERIVRILFDGFDESIRFATQPWKKRGHILKVIHYGSYARGDWVDDPVGGYISDYDLLVVVNDDRLTDPVDYWSKADDQLLREVTITKTISAPVNFIVHDLNDVNQQLSHGRPFFTDIAERYSPHYKITDEELAWLSERVDVLQTLVKVACEERLSAQS